MDDIGNDSADASAVRNDQKKNEGNVCHQKDRKDGSSLETALQNVMQMEYLPDEVKNSFIAAYIADTNSSPKAQQLKCFMDDINALKPERRHSFTKAAVKAYLDDKKSEHTRFGSVAKQEQCTGTVPMAGDPQCTGTVPMAGDPVASQVACHSCDSDGEDSYEYDAETGNGGTCEKRRRGLATRPLDVLETRHSNMADALDTLGPCIIAKRTDTAPPGSLVPEGWHIQIFQCYDKTCQTKILVWSPTKDLASKPAFSLIYDEGKHRAHNPIDWEAWYRYRARKNPANPDWDVETYPPKPGLPHFVLVAVAEVLSITPNVNPADAAKSVRDRYRNAPHPLFANPGSFQKILMKQIRDYAGRGKRRLKSMKPSPTVERVEYFSDIDTYISTHRIDYDRLQQIGWKPALRMGPEWTHEMAKALRRENVFAGLGVQEQLPETHLVVLDSDEVLSNDRWQTLHQASDKVHMTGPDTRRRTVVFSSIALLTNSVWCEHMSWEVCGSVDGTHGMSDSSYKLITLGVNAFCKHEMRRSFHPLVYIWGEGEREIVALHGFLNWKIAIRHLFGIESVCFKRGVVSDSTTVFSNSVSAAFPGSPPLSCYPHIIRKFKLDGRRGNGSYAAKVKNTDHSWLRTEAEEAIKRCSVCKTEQQMLKMWELTKKQWILDGQEALAETFAKTYINNNNFNKWNYTASGQHGCVPCNNAMESHHLQMKGSKYFYGYMEHGADMHTCLTREFVGLVHEASVSLSSPSWGLPVLDYARASKNNEFMKFQSLLDPKVDMKEYNDGWLINDVMYVATPITEDDIRNMELALAGKMEDDAHVHTGDSDIRDVLLSRTARFHYVKESVWTVGNETNTYFHCDCRDYYYKQWCFQSAYMQHRDNLELLGQRITKRQPKSSSSSKRRKVIADALKAAGERIGGQNRNGVK
ncbi:hypothetical protein IV203_027829 [Nitzschia inconspicua]|uniref:Uncharacterized protein n=1 Tax=Nitzschia inconspicua TaxID=303405 RepID=A0A9K3LY06_9STRA|nr:hypothetical protein IV203_027829 [Nitzschia inconspicua]